MEEKYGFVYLWRDKKHKRYYVGCHWGTVGDGYICSSRWMMKSYKRRPDDFKRRILSIINIRDYLLEEENKYLSMIKDEEIGKRYYNLSNKKFGHWSTNEESRLTVGEKISASPMRNQRIREANTGKKHSDETKEKIRQIRLGTTLSEETRKKISENHNRIYDEEFSKKISNYAKNRPIEVRNKMSEAAKKRILDGSLGMKNKTHSDETKLKMSIKAKEIVQCPCCGQKGAKNPMKRWHFTNCRKRKNGIHN